MPAADPGVEHAQVIVNLGDRADGRTRIVARRFLRNRNRRAQAADKVDIGLRHLPQELPGEPRKAFDIPPLPFGIERVERERAFARAADAGQANQLIARQNQIDVAKVMLAGTFDDDICSGHQCADRFQSVVTRDLPPRGERPQAGAQTVNSTAERRGRKGGKFSGANSTFMSAIDSNYELLDFGDGRKLERFGDVVLNRPCPAAERLPQSRPELWANATARFRGPRTGDGSWAPNKKLWQPAEWDFPREVGSAFRLRLDALPSGQVGVFPEQRENWNWIAKQVGALSGKRLWKAGRFDQSVESICLYGREHARGGCGGGERRACRCGAGHRGPGARECSDSLIWRSDRFVGSRTMQ